MLTVSQFVNVPTVMLSSALSVRSLVSPVLRAVTVPRSERPPKASALPKSAVRVTSDA